MAYIDPNKFLPISLINTLKSFGAWDVDDVEWVEMIEKFENSAISIVRASVNFDAIKDDNPLLEDLVSKHVQSQLLIPLVHMDEMRENGALALEQFTVMMDRIKTNQRENGITTDEENQRKIAGVMVF